MEYVELFRVLLNSCADWTLAEKALVHKILKSMGVTVFQRRSWLAKLRVSLMRSNNRTKESLTSNQKEDRFGIPPATFLHCLRECGLNLSIEEEAVLLDCLDTEQLAYQIAKGNQNKDRSDAYLLSGSNGAMGISLIDYESFVNFCARHCGDWYDAAPDIDDAIRSVIGTVRNSWNGVQEFMILLRSFDESGDGRISKRTFQICLRRSRLFSELSESVLNALADLLSVEGGGKVEYAKFVVYLRTICSSVNTSKNSSAEHIAAELIKKATDSSNTLRPLREWLVQNTDSDSFILTPRDVQSLLRKFEVVYSTSDLELFMEKFGKSLSDANSASSTSLASNTVVDSRELLAHLLKIRPHWTELQSSLRKRLQSAFAHAEIKTDSAGNHSPRRSNEPAGSTLIIKVHSRLKAFASTSSHAFTSSAMVEREIFSLVCRNAEIHLSDDDIWKLADATDPNIISSHISCDILLDLLSNVDEIGRKHLRLGEGGNFAIEHLRNLLWKTGSRLDRDKAEWITDVRTLFRGFDPRGTGSITVDDFQNALSILNASVAESSLLDISGGSKYIQLEEVLNLVLVPPNTKGIEEREEDIKTTTRKMFTQPKVDRNSPVSKVLHLTRKRLKKFIVSDQTLEEAWISLLKVFQRFDPDDSSSISPRDFYIAVSALMEDDEAVISQDEWKEIVDHFKILDPRKPSSSTSSERIGQTAKVDYMSFCEAVLDPKEINQSFHTLQSSLLSDRAVGNDNKSTKSLTFDGTITGRSVGSRSAASRERAPRDRDTLPRQQNVNKTTSALPPSGTPKSYPWLGRNDSNSRTHSLNEKAVKPPFKRAPSATWQ